MVASRFKDYAFRIGDDIAEEWMQAIAGWGEIGLPHPSLAELAALAKIRVGVNLRVLCAYREEQFVALAVSHVEPGAIHGVNLKAYRLFGTQLHDYSRIYAKDKEAMAYLIEIAKQDARSLGADVIQWVNCLTSDAGQGIPAKYCEVTLTGLLDTTGAEKGWQQITERKSIKRDWKKVSKMPGYRVETLVGPEIRRHDIELLAEMHRERWHFSGVKSQFHGVHRVEEYMNYIENKVLTRIWLGDEILGQHYGMLYGDLLLFHTPVINIKYMDFSPLKAILAETAEFCRNRNLRYLDFGLGDESYKDYSTNETRRIQEVLIPRSLRGFLVWIIRRLGVVTYAKKGMAWIKLKSNQLRSRGCRLSSSQLWQLNAAEIAGEVTGTHSPVLLKDYAAFVDNRRHESVGVLRAEYDLYKGGWRCLVFPASASTRFWVLPQTKQESVQSGVRHLSLVMAVDAAIAQPVPPPAQDVTLLRQALGRLFGGASVIVFIPSSLGFPESMLRDAGFESYAAQSSSRTPGEKRSEDSE